MADQVEHFEFEDVSADLSNTFLDTIARDAFLHVFGAALRPGENEVQAITFGRAFSLIAAHSKHVTGLDGWQPPSPFADAATILASAEAFFSVEDVDYQALATAWVNALTSFLFGAPAAVPTEEQGTGTDEDFLTTTPAASTSGSST